MKIDFEFDTPNGVFRDAIHLTEDHTFTEAEIEAMKQQRLDNWLAIVNAPVMPIDESVPPPIVPADIIDIAGETYQRLVGVPTSGAKLIEVNSVWYFKI
jgi:hypothetical protein